jgi:hypothetical protein
MDKVSRIIHRVSFNENDFIILLEEKGYKCTGQVRFEYHHPNSDKIITVVWEEKDE